ncbi:hypothetical protein F5B17DRAFT_392771 [Nemania serpens]|nr:hypothetical protein F5B17DRAFT_392771 [Nemania serpens]
MCFTYMALSLFLSSPRLLLLQGLPWNTGLDQIRMYITKSRWLTHSPHTNGIMHNSVDPTLDRKSSRLANPAICKSEW